MVWSWTSGLEVGWVGCQGNLGAILHPFCLQFEGKKWKFCQILGLFFYQSTKCEKLRFVSIFFCTYLKRKFVTLGKDFTRKVYFFFDWLFYLFFSEGINKNSVLVNFILYQKRCFIEFLGLKLIAFDAVFISKFFWYGTVSSWIIFLFWILKLLFSTILVKIFVVWTN